MFSFNESWFQQKIEGEAELHSALFRRTEASEDAATAKRKTNLRKIALSCDHQLDGEEFEGERVTSTVDERKSCATGKCIKRKYKSQDDGQTPPKCKKTCSAKHPTSSCSASQNQSLLTTHGNGSATLERKSGTNHGRTALRSKMARKMEGARFRWINEQLYTTTGHKAKKMFDEDPTLFDVYHSGFATQVSKWPLNPLDKIIANVQSLPTNLIIADFGCGEAKLAKSVPHTVHSFDLVATDSRITACDMAHVQLSNRSVDVVIFCLSLMGSNVSDFIREARRVLKKGGLLKICEIASRIESVDGFVANVERFGFKLIKTDTVSKLFLDFEFRAKSTRKDASSIPNIHLNPCIYKRR